jgi:hypothetical protein
LIISNENIKEDTSEKRTQFQTTLISAGLLCLIITVILLFSTQLMETTSLEFFFVTLISGILFGMAEFFEGHGYILLPKDYHKPLSYFGSPTLFQLVRVIGYIPYLLLCYNGLIFVGEINLELIFIVVIFYLPYILGRASWRWTRLRSWFESIDS